MMYPDMPPAVESMVDAQETALRDALAGIVARRQEALARFYDATVSRVYGLALRITARSDAAEEVTADVYLQVWNQAERFDQGRGCVLAWRGCSPSAAAVPSTTCVVPTKLNRGPSHRKRPVLPGRIPRIC